MTSPISQKSRLVLLDGAGEAQALILRAPLFSGSFVVLARERCLFERLDTASGLNARTALAAARMHAQTAAPYQRSAALITRHGASFGIWWWDAQWVAERLEAVGIDPAAKILPEPLARASGEGWRVVKASSGYEAQLWRGGFLVADLWRKRPFDAQAWQDFVRVQSDQMSAEGVSLTAQEPPYNLKSPYRRMQLSEWTGERLVQAAGAIAAVLLLSVAGYFGGQAIGLNRSAAAIEKQAALVKAKTPKNLAAQGSVSSLIALKAAVEAPDPVVLLENAQKIVQPFGFKVLAFTADAKKVRIVLPQEAKDHVSIIASDLEASPYFVDVKPSLDSDKKRLIIDMAPQGAKRPAAKARVAVAVEDPLVVPRP